MPCPHSPAPPSAWPRPYNMIDPIGLVEMLAELACDPNAPLEYREGAIESLRNLAAAPASKIPWWLAEIARETLGEIALATMPEGRPN